MKFQSMSCLSCRRATANKGSRNKSIHSIVKRTVSEYVQKSTIHGIAYVGDNQRNKFERFWWLIILLCSIFGASYSIYQAYRTMKDNPIIESPSLARTPRWEIPFPAVTVCPVSREGISAFALNVTSWPDSLKRLLPDNMTDSVLRAHYLTAVHIESFLPQRSDQNKYDILRQILPEIKIISSEFKSFLTRFEVPWQNMITAYGACVTVNMFSERDILRDGVILSSIDNTADKMERLWSRDTGFSINVPQPNYTCPFRSFIPTDFLKFYFKINDSQRILESNSEISVSFHAPDEFPLLGKRRHSEAFIVKSGNTIYIEVKADLVASEGIENYEPKVRQCYYSDERRLKYFKSYTQNNCKTECLADLYLSKCRCVPHHLPHFNNTKFCSMDFKCPVEAHNEFYSPDFTEDALRTPFDKCNCLPSCTQLLYVPRLTETSVGTTSSTILEIFISDLHLNKRVRTELHSISEFLSNCGGSLGLFLGMSIFSVIELIYFCTFRLCLHSRKQLTNCNE